MKRLISLILVFALLTGCTPAVTTENKTETVKNVTEKIEDKPLDESFDSVPEFDELSDPALLQYIEDVVYNNVVTDLNSEAYFIENVKATYISKEYLEEVGYNSQENIYFGYTLSELNESFQGTRYVFTLGENGETIVTEFQEYDNTYEKILKNIAVGTGVIFVCVTVSVVSGVMGAPAVSLIFAASAESATVMGLSSGVFSGVSAGVVKGFETGDINEALKEAALAGSEGFKWGAISGAISGGAGKTIELKGATLNGLTMNEAALIQKESKYPAELIKNFHSFDEYQVYKTSNLKPVKVNGKLALTQDIDWDFVGDIEDGRTNAQRVIDGLAPLDASGKSYEVHHIGQKSDSPFAILTNEQHKKNYSIIHKNTGTQASEIDRNTFSKEKREFWLSLLNNK